MVFTSYCLIREDSAATYVGATVDMEHRLRQHNGIIKGGAVATTSALAKGHNWSILCNVSGFPTWQSTLQFEWMWKYISRKKKGTPAYRRISALIDLVNMDKATSKAEPFVSFAPLHISIFKQCLETDNLKNVELKYAIICPISDISGNTIK
jgi:structure-specific endonuclease subunit SLX1